MNVICPNCQATLKVDESFNENNVNCPNCGNEFFFIMSETSQSDSLGQEGLQREPENVSEKPTMEQWLRTVGIRTWSGLIAFFRRERPMTTDISTFVEPSMAFELKRLFPLVVCCLVFGWIGSLIFSHAEVYRDWDDTRWTILPVCLLACWLASRGMLHFVRPKQRPWVQWLFVALFSAIVSINLLIFFQYCVTNEQLMRNIAKARGRNASFFKIIIVSIGWCYGQAFNEYASFPARLLGFIGGVGFCEESVKLLPVYLLVSRRKKLPFRVDLSFRSFLMLGFFSGLGFGIAENFSSQYCLSWRNDSIGLQLLRWFACAPSHAIYTMIDAAFFWMFCRRILTTDDERTRFAWFAKCVAAVAVLHGLYDVLVRYSGLGMLLDAASLVLLWCVVQHATHLEDSDKIGDQDPFADFEPRTVNTFGKSFLKTYLLVAAVVVLFVMINVVIA